MGKETVKDVVVEKSCKEIYMVGCVAFSLSALVLIIISGNKDRGRKCYYEYLVMASLHLTSHLIALSVRLAQHLTSDCV